jgi:uncharacterized protein (TIGR03083 family)
MTAPTTQVDTIPEIDHDEAMDLAATEADRVLTLADTLAGADWSRPTDCSQWDVRAVLGHMLGMLELQADVEERMRQVKTAARLAAQSGAFRLHEMTALQVREHAHLTTAELTQALRDATPRGLAARRTTTGEQRAAPYDTQLPGEAPWTFGYLFDIIHTRDPWMHRIDICRATGRDIHLTPAHDGRIVANVVAEWERRHGQSFTLNLTGPAGGTFHAGQDGPVLSLDAIEFCRILSGRGSGNGLLGTAVPF